MIRVAVAVLALAFPAPVGLCEQEDRVKLVETILKVQAANAFLLPEVRGSATVTKSFVMKEDQEKIKHLERNNPERLRKLRNLMPPASDNYAVDFAVKGDRQRVTRYEFDPSLQSRGKVLFDRIDLPMSVWAYVPHEERAFHADRANSQYDLQQGEDFRHEAFNCPDLRTPCSTLLANAAKNAQYWDVSVATDGSLTIKCGAELKPVSPKWDAQFVLDPAAGYSLTRFTQTSDWGDGTVRNISTAVQRRQIGDALVPVGMSCSVDWKYNPNSMIVLGDTEETCVVEITEIDPTAKIDDSIFTVDALDFAVGTKVNDTVAGVVYKYGAAALHERALETALGDVTADLDKIVPVSAALAVPATPGDAQPPRPDDVAGYRLRAAAWFAAAAVALLVVAFVAVSKVRRKRGGRTPD